MTNLDYRYDRIQDINDYGSNVQMYIQLSQITHYYGINQANYVGNISYLIGQKEFKTPNEWLEFYYESGEQSLQGRKEGTLNIQQHGRTLKELKELVCYLYNNIQKDKILIETSYPLLKNVTIRQCFDSFMFLVLGHSWNGMVIRENNVIATLQREEYLSEFTFEKASPDIDIKYGIDIIVKKDYNIVAGIQVKPAKYSKHKMVISDYAKKQHMEFKRNFNIKTATYIYADDYGVIDEDMNYFVVFE